MKKLTKYLAINVSQLRRGRKAQHKEGRWIFSMCKNKQANVSIIINLPSLIKDKDYASLGSALSFVIKIYKL